MICHSKDLIVCLPEETLPRGEVRSFEQCVLKDAFNAAEGLNHVSPVVVKVPELAIVLLMGPPERVLLQYLILFEVLAYAPALVVG